MVVLIILLALILLIFFVPYGVDAAYEEEVLTVKVKAGPVRIRLLPKKPLTEKQQARRDKKQAKKAAKKKAAEEKKKKAAEEAEGKPKDETIKLGKKREITLDFLIALARMAVRAVRRFFRSFSIDFLKLHYIVAGPDPYNVAMQYGILCAAIEELCALSAGKIRLRRKDIAIGSDFTAQKQTINARVVITLQLYKLVHLAVAFGVEYLKWKWNDRREKKTAAETESEDENGRQQDQRAHGHHRW